MLYTFDYNAFRKGREELFNKIHHHVAEVTRQKDEFNRQRDETDPNRNLWKYFIGKVSEYAAYAYIFYSATTMVTKPDLKIYPYGDAGSDLTCTASTGIYNIHVKSCTITSQKEFGDAWLFRRDEQLVEKPKSNDIIVLTKEVEGGKIEILKIMKGIDAMMSYVTPYTANGFPILKKWKLDYEDIKYERDFRIL